MSILIPGYYNSPVFVRAHSVAETFPADTKRWINVGLTFVHRLRRCTNEARNKMFYRYISAEVLFVILKLCI